MKILERKEQLKSIEDPQHTHLSYVTFDDITSIPSLNDQIVIAVRAPAGTKLEVPDPDEDMAPGKRRYQIFMKSPGGEIEVLLVRSREETPEPLVETDGLLSEEAKQEIDAGIADLFPESVLTSDLHVTDLFM
eukprot:TRINITY_DN1902_c0_g1_i4.p1 TRINITY_DN1902_c0_g1~~TRINITY_DN1902_c0_g1_i4.p1  ORF type:complete len:133 (-),score=29.98 TRINITY_DN1902_c0_g1_i4:89-487(-)